MFGGGVDDHVVEGLVHVAVHRVGHHLGFADGQFESFPTHGFHQDGQGHLATSLHLPRIGPLGGQHPNGYVTDELLVEARLDHAGGELIASPLAGQGGGVHADGHGDGRLVHGDARQGNGVFHIGESVADHDVVDAGDRRNVAGDHSFGGGFPVHANGAKQFGNLHVFNMLVALIVVVNPRNLLAFFQGAGVDTHQGDASQKGRRVQVGDMRLEGGVDGGGRLGQYLVDDVEKRLKIGGVRNVAIARIFGGRLAFPAGGVKNRQVEEGFGGGRGLGVVQRGSQFEEEVLGFLHHLVDAGVGAVGLIHHDNDGHFGSQGLAQHEPGLWQWPLGGVDKQYHAVDHGKPTFNFATKISVARSVNDVNNEVIAVLA